MNREQYTFAAQDRTFSVTVVRKKGKEHQSPYPK